MNNNTKIRLRLSKNLFESITREILAEAKINGGGVTNGASFAPGNGEQYAAGTRKVRKTLGEDESTVGQHFDLDIRSERGDGSIQRYQLKNVKLINPNDRVFEKPNGTTVVLAPSDKYTATRVGGLGEDAPRLAGSPTKTNSQGSKNLSAYSSVGFTKAPSAKAAIEKRLAEMEDNVAEDKIEESVKKRKLKR